MELISKGFKILNDIIDSYKRIKKEYPLINPENKKGAIIMNIIRIGDNILKAKNPKVLWERTSGLTINIK